VAEAARAIADAVDPDANIISGLVLDESMVDEIKVTVIATGSNDTTGEVSAALADSTSAPVEETQEPLWRRRSEELPAEQEVEPNPMQQSAFADAEEPQPEEKQEKVPFYRKVLAHTHQSDKGGFGPNWSNVDDYDIPTVLRKQLD